MRSKGEPFQGMRWRGWLWPWGLAAAVLLAALAALILPSPLEAWIQDRWTSLQDGRLEAMLEPEEAFPGSHFALRVWKLRSGELIDVALDDPTGKREALGRRRASENGVLELVLASSLRVPPGQYQVMLLGPGSQVRWAQRLSVCG